MTAWKTRTPALFYLDNTDDRGYSCFDFRSRLTATDTDAPNTPIVESESVMTRIWISLMVPTRRSIRPLLTIALCGWAATSAATAATGQGVRNDCDPAIPRHVRVVGSQTTSANGETSWILEPEIQRIPKIAGSVGSLPPHIERRLSYAFDLAQRGAVYSAVSEFQAVLGLCALEQDAQDGSTSHREALRQGLIALDEADQFGGEQVDWRDSADVRRIALGHTTPVLNQPGQPVVDSIQAVQAYYAYAEQRLVYACHGLPGASLALYGLGRTVTAPGMPVAHSAGKAALYHRAALTIAPQNALSANELGVLLAQHGELDGAERLFRYCAEVQPSPEAFVNLSVVYARKGDQDASRAALAAGQAMSTRAQDRAGTDSGAAAVTRNQVGASEHDDTNEKPRALEKLHQYMAKSPASQLILHVFRR